MINKEIYFSLETKKILQELPKVDVKREDSGVEKELLQDPRARLERSAARSVQSEILDQGRKRFLTAEEFH